MIPDNLRVDFRDGVVATVQLNGQEEGTANFGDGPIPTTRTVNEGVLGAEISATTRSAIGALVSAFEGDLSRKKQKAAAALQAAADVAAAKAEQAQTAADEAQ